MNSPKISVVIPVYNPEPVFLRNAIDSVRKQTYQAFEIVISDDTENEQLVASIIDDQNSEPPIKCFSHKGEKGIFSNLNNAISHAQGEFIQILCQDDELKPNCLEEQKKVLARHPGVGIVFSQFDVISEKGEKGKLESKFNYRYQFPDYLKKDDMKYWLLVFGCLPGNLSPVMIRKSVIDRIGLFNPDLKYAGDFDYWSRAAQHVDFYFNKKSLLYVRRHDQQASRTLSYSELVKDRIAVYSRLLENQTYPLDRTKISWYLNQAVGAQHFHLFLRSLIKHKLLLPHLKSHISLLNHRPFNLFKSALMYVLTLNGRIKWLNYPLHAG